MNGAPGSEAGGGGGLGGGLGFWGENLGVEGVGVVVGLASSMSSECAGSSLGGEGVELGLGLFAARRPVSWARVTGSSEA